MRAAWKPPSQPWVLHATGSLGHLTQRWIDTQASTCERYGSRLLGLEAADGAVRRPYWWLAGDRPDLALAFRARVKSRGLSLYWITAQLRRSLPGVVHAHYGSTGPEVLALARSLSAGLVTSFYGFEATKEIFTADPHWRATYRRLFDRGEAFLAEGPAMAARIAALGCDPDRIHVVRLPADADGLRGVPAEKDHGFLVALAGRFIPKKGFELGIRAFARGLGDRADARLLLMGGGELEGSYRRVVAELGIEDRVVWAGRVPFEDFMHRLARAHVALYPSLTAPDGDSEGGAPVTLIEGQWVGVPALVSDHDDLPFVAAPEGSVVLGDYAEDSWADALRSLYEDRSRLAAMSREAARFARELHSPEANARARERVYDAAR